MKPVALFYAGCNGAGKSSLRKKRILTAKAAGFFVELRYVGLACFDLNIERVAQRVAKGGHAIDDQTIERRYKTSLANLPVALQWVDEASIWDNSYEVPQLHLVVSPSSVTVLKANQPRWIKEIFNVVKLGRVVTDVAAD